MNTGTGKTEIAKSCSSGCSDCNTSTGWCDACQSRYAKDNAGKCHSCPSNCASCLWEYGNTVSCETCDSGYELATNSSTGAGPFYCKKTETICLAGTYVSGTSCVDCPTGTYSSGSNADSCLDCPSGTFSSTTGASQCLPCPSEESTNGNCNASGFWCTVDWTPSSDGTNCTKCADGTYSNGSNRSCEQCPTGCKTCKGNNLTGGADCLSCKDGYYLSDSNCVLESNSSSSGANSGSNTTTRTCASEYSSKPNECKTSQGVIYCCPNPQDCDPSGVSQECSILWYKN